MMEVTLKHLAALAVVLALVGFMALGWFRYRDFLHQGSRPTEATIKLNQMEKSGVPIFELEDIKGVKHSLQSYSDKVVIINFWASWCEPCVREFPSMMRLLKTFSKDVVILAISHDKDFEDLTTFVEAFDMQGLDNFIVFWDKDAQIAKKYGTKVLPESFILSRGLNLERKVTGVEEWDQPLAIRYFENLIGF